MSWRLALLAFALCSMHLIQARSVQAPTTAPTTQEPGRPLWTPDNGMSREDWYRCHGFPCSQWERTQIKLHQLKVMSARLDPDSPVLDPQNQPDAMKTAADQDTLDGCIWLTEDQIEAMMEENGMVEKAPGSAAHPTMSKRQVSPGVATAGYSRWPMPIHYKFDGAHPLYEQDEIRRAVAHIESETCIQFREVATDQQLAENHLLVTRQSTGCHSYVGRVGLNAQQINLQSACVYTFGIPVHEFVHALGVWHEQQRWDRDDTINVLWDNIGAYRSQFYKQTSSDLGTHYDPASVMHYAGTDGASYGKNSMVTRNPLYQQNMGQRVGLSFRDAQLLNKVYCNDRCTNPLPQPCQRGGYQDPKACDRCRCPPGFTGTYCQSLAPSNAACGGEVALSPDQVTTVQSPGYDSPGYYPEDAQCNWRFTVPAGYVVSLQFMNDFGIYCGYSDACFHWAEVQYEANKNTQGPRFCCRSGPAEAIQSEWAEMTLLFRSDYRGSSTNSRRGFRALVRAMPDPRGPPPTQHPTTTTSTTTSTTTTTRAPTTTPTTRAPTTTTTRPVASITTTRAPTPTTRATTTPRPTTTSTSTSTTTTSSGNEECLQVDLSLALDSSGSITNLGWQKLLRFANHLLMRMRVSPSCARVAVLSFGTEAYPYSLLAQNQGNTDIYDVILRMPFKDEWTNTAAALRMLREQVYVTGRGDREGVSNVVVLVTDGPSNRLQEQTVPQAEAARSSGIQILTVGVGPDVNERELSDITGDVSRNLYTQNLDSLLDQAFIQTIYTKVKALSGDDGVEVSVGGGEETGGEEEPTGGAPYLWHCSFEDAAGSGTWCDVTEATDDTFDWTLTSDPTPSDPTGPDAAQSGNFYVFIEATGRNPGDQARLSLPAVPSSSTYCLSFSFHMYGYHINELVVARETAGGSRTALWSEKGDRSNQWLRASVSESLQAGERFVLTASRGNGYSGDIGLDTLSVTQGNC